MLKPFAALSSSTIILMVQQNYFQLCS